MKDFHINKGINRPLEFKGIKAQYIGYLAAGLVVLLILFAIAYVAGVPVYLGLAITLLLGTGLFFLVFRYSNKYGEYGLVKESAYRQVPGGIICRSRKVLLHLRSKFNS